MSRENLELARQVMDALSQRDLPRLISLADPEVEWRSFFAIGQTGGVYRGHDGTRQYMADLRDAWELVEAEVTDDLVVGSVVLLVGRIHYRGKASGVETDTSVGWLLRFRNGKAVSFRAFRDPEQARDAVGLRE